VFSLLIPDEQVVALVADSHVGLSPNLCRLAPLVPLYTDTDAGATGPGVALFLHPGFEAGTRGIILRLTFTQSVSGFTVCA
jgi:hypothetical protein